MFCRAFSILVALALIPMGAFASCGSEHCPIDMGMLWEESMLSFDLSQQYIDQNQPRVGTHNATVGQIPSAEDEVRTVSRVTSAHVMYQPAGGWTLSATLPFVNRYHEHIRNGGGSPELQRWNFTGVGDLEAQGSRTFGSGAEGSIRYHVTAGFKAPASSTSSHPTAMSLSRRLARGTGPGARSPARVRNGRSRRRCSGVYTARYRSASACWGMPTVGGPSGTAWARSSRRTSA